MLNRGFLFYIHSPTDRKVGKTNCKNLADIQNSVRLKRQPPVGVRKYGFHTHFYVLFALPLISHKTWLQKFVLSRNAIIHRQVLTAIHHFKLVALGQHTWLGITAGKREFWRQRHPVYAAWQLTRAVGLYRYLLASGFKPPNQLVIHHKRGLAASQHYQWSLGIFVNLGDYGWQRHLRASIVAGVTKVAFQVAAAEAHKHTCRASVVALALQRAEYFIHFPHGARFQIMLPCCSSSSFM